MVMLSPREICRHIIYVEHFKLRLLRDVCMLYTGVLVSDSLLHMLSNQI